MTKMFLATALCVTIFLTVPDEPRAAKVPSSGSQPPAAEREPLVTSRPAKSHKEIRAGTEVETTTHALRPVVAEYVTAVASGGYWEEGDRSGIIRVIVVQQGWEHVTSRVYLEWIAEGQSHELKIIRQAPVDEINEAGVWSIDSPIMVPSASGLLIDLPATRMDLSRNRKFKVIIPALGVGNFEVE